jgi:hypothetical protein
MLLAAVDEAALYIANADDRRQARNQARRSLKHLLDGLRNTNERPAPMGRGTTPKRGLEARHRHVRPPDT